MCMQNRSKWQTLKETKEVYVVRVIVNGKIYSPFGIFEWVLGLTARAKQAYDTYLEKQVQMFHSFETIEDAERYLNVVNTISNRCKYGSYDVAIYKALIPAGRKICTGIQEIGHNSNVTCIGSKILTLVECKRTRHYVVGWGNDCMLAA